MITVTDKIINCLSGKEELFNDLIEQLDSYNGYLGDDRWYPMDELSELLDGRDALEILRMARHGSFDPDEDYFRTNVYGNLESTWEIDYREYLTKWFVEDLSVNREHLIIDDEKLNELLDRLQEEV